MERRRFLAGVGTGVLAGFSGCGGVTSPARGEDVTRIDRVEVAPVELDAVSFGGEPVRHFTPDHPGSITLSVTNETGSEKSIGPLSTEGPLKSQSNESDEVAHTLYCLTESKANDIIPDEPATGSCWRINDSFVVTLEYLSRKFEGGETYSGTYTLAGHQRTPADEGPCVPPGEYEFTDYLEIGERGESDRTWFDVEFTIVISEG